MSGAFSTDLRGRVLDAVEAGSSVRRAAARFGVGVSTAIRWVRRWRETGERTTRKQGHPVGSRLDAHEDYLLGLIEQTVDNTLDEMRARLAEERGVRAGYSNDGVFSGLGHGVGLGWDAPWLAPGDATVLEPGMVLCIERTIRKDGYLGDFEETVVVTEDGCEKITDARARWW